MAAKPSIVNTTPSNGPNATVFADVSCDKRQGAVTMRA